MGPCHPGLVVLCRPTNSTGIHVHSGDIIPFRLHVILVAHVRGGKQQAEGTCTTVPIKLHKEIVDAEIQHFKLPQKWYLPGPL
jgi:hypothetical protein